MKIGIDLGTGSVKIMAVVGARGPGAPAREFSASRPYPLSAPESGAAETDPELWIAAIRDSWCELRAALSASGIDEAVESVGVDGHMHGFVALDRSGAAVRPALTWADARGGPYIKAFDAVDAEARERLRNAPAAGMAAVSLLFMKHREPEAYARTSRILFPKDYVRFRLTGDLASDPGDASAGLLYDFVEGTWSDAVAAALGLDSSVLPPIRASFSSGGTISEAGAAATGLPAGVPVATGSSDAACALYGSGLFAELFSIPGHSAVPAAEGSGRATSRVGGLSGPRIPAPSARVGSVERAIQIAVGSGAQVIEPVRGLPDYEAALNCYETAVPGVRYRMAAMLNGGVALEWVRAFLSIGWDEFYAELDAGRVRFPEDLIFIPYLTGERSPYNDPAARGAWIGLGLHHGRLELLAAALEGVACTVRLGVETLGASGCPAYLVGGSARRPAWRRFLASTLGRPLELCAVTDSAARGAAYLGGTLVGGGDPPRPGTTTIEPEALPWFDRYYRRFLNSYRALYGDGGAYSER